MSIIGQKERKTQQRVVKLFRETLGYAYLGSWEEREGNRNIEPEFLRAWLKTQGHPDALIRAEESETVSAFNDLSLIQLIVERGVDAVNALPNGIKKNKEAVAETIENNVRKLIIDESPINPKYYEKMSELLDALIALRKQAALDYAAYLAKIVELTKQVKSGPGGAAYPQPLNTPAKKALYRLTVIEHNGAGAVALPNKTRLELHVRPKTNARQRERILHQWYFSMPSLVVGAVLVSISARNWRPNSRSCTHRPWAVSHSPALTDGSEPTTVTRSRCPLAFTLSTP
jgi:hypothetical protein